MRVLVTRPEPAATRTGERLRALGAEPVLLPVSEMVAAPEALADLDPARFRGVVVTSARVADVLGAKASSRVVDGLRPLPAYAVGEATGAALRGLGFADVRVAGGTAEHLAAMLMAEAGGARGGSGARPLLYLAGEPRSPRLKAALAVAGLPVEIRVVYRMAARAMAAHVMRAALFDPPAAAVLLYSRETAALFFGLLDRHGLADALLPMRILCLSGQVAEAVPAGLAGRIEIAAAPDEAGLFALMAAKAT